MHKKIKIKVVGVGGGGNNVVSSSAVQQKCKDMVSFLAINTDLQALEKIGEIPTLQIGKKLTSGFGTGGSPENGRAAAEEDFTDLVNHFEGDDIVMITAGMGGGTGTGAAPVVAKAAKEAGAIVLAAVTTPFSYESSRKKEIAEAGVKALNEAVDSIMCISNTKIEKSVDDDDLDAAVGYRIADADVINYIQAMDVILTNENIANIDYADVANILKAPGFAMVGKGLNADVSIATREALAPKFVEPNDISESSNILVSISGPKIKFKDANVVATIINNKLHGKVNSQIGLTKTGPETELSVTIIATGISKASNATRKLPQVNDRLEQSEFIFLDHSNSIFQQIEATFIDGINYDTPTFQRWERRLISNVI